MTRLDHNPGALALCLLAGLLPGAAACLVHYASQPDWWPGFQHVGVIAAAGVGLLIGAQAGRWWTGLLGLAVGAGVGWLDLQAFDVCYRRFGWSLSSASCVPVWGFGLGLWAALANPSWTRAGAAPLLGALCDLGARVAWADFVAAPALAEARQAWGEAMWLLASQTYLLPALVITACAATWSRPSAPAG